MLHISKTSKLDGIRSWSLEALTTCPASKNKDGSLVDACKGCYATTGRYVMKNVYTPRRLNKEDWQRDAWVADMVQALDTDRYFRWFDSGDMYDIRLARKILAIMQATPHVKHWLPTRMHKFSKFMPVINEMNALPNVVVRFSSDSVTGGTVAGQYTSTIVPTVDDAGTAVACRAYENAGKCSGCRACWNKSVDVIAYVAHGAKMRKVITLVQA